MLLRRLCALVLALAVAACGSGQPAATSTSGGPTGAGPLAALPECTSPPARRPDIDKVRGLSLPDGSVITNVTQQDPLVTVLAFVPLTPAQFEAAYPNMDSIEVLITENEVFEAELLVSNGEYRNFFKATATCQNGSNVLAVVAPEVDAEGLPVPQRATPAPSPSS